MNIYWKYGVICSVCRGPGFAPAGPLAPADFKGPGPGGAAAPAEFWGPAPGGAAAPANWTGPAGAGAGPGVPVPHPECFFLNIIYHNS